MPNEYTNLVPHAIAATHLAKEGQETHAGRTVGYVVTNNESRISENRALPDNEPSEIQESAILYRGQPGSICAFFF